MINQSGGGKLNCVGFAVGVLLLIAPLVLAVDSITEIATIDELQVEARVGALFWMGTVVFFGSFAGYFGYVMVGFHFDSLPARPGWLFWAMLIVGTFWLLHLGLGTIVGLALLTFTFNQRQKFGAADLNAVEAAAQG